MVNIIESEVKVLILCDKSVNIFLRSTPIVVSLVLARKDTNCDFFVYV
jgi:hypothetical protein